MPVEDCLNNLLAQFDKPCPHEPLKNSTFENQMKRKNDKSETPKPVGKKDWKKKNSRLRDAKVTRTRDFEIHQKLFRGFETGPKLKHFSAVFLMPVGEAELPTPNSMATFHLCQTGSDSEGLALLATAVITANCQQASLSCGGQHTDTLDAAGQCLYW